MAEFIYGSICLSDVPKELFKKVKCQDGKERVYLNIAIKKRKEVGKYGHTHFITCEPKDKDERKDGVNYICGDLTEYVAKGNTPSAEDVNSAPAAGANDLPF